MAKLKATARENKGSRASRKLRSEGMIPGIVYGHGEAPEPITVSEHDVELALLHGERLLEMNLGSKTQNVLIKDVQWDTFGQTVLHIDLNRVDLDERVVVSVPVHLRGTPEGVAEGGVLTQQFAEVSIECAVRSIPDEFVVEVHDMKLGDQLHLKDIELPADVELQDEPEELLCQVRLVEEEVPAEETEMLAEPEVIGEVAEEGEDEGADEGAE
ncbi:MAG: 50S ribosomal protein L25 [Phycisphaerae bacterium]